MNQLVNPPDNPPAASHEELRDLRDRQRAIDQLRDNTEGGGRAFGSSRKLVQIFNAGMMPAANDHFFSAHPVELNGTETESGAGTPVVDTNTTLLVDVIGSQVPAVGDLLTAYAVGGRWVAERGLGNQVNCFALKCGQCQLPLQDLTLSWVNPILGNGSATLAFTGSTWKSGCVNGLTFELLCTLGALELRVIYYTAGACPTGQQQYCSNLRGSPFELTLSSVSCDPLALVYTSMSDSCPTVTNSGYTQFTVTGPQPQQPVPGTFCCISVSTVVCGCVAPGMITVTVQKNNAAGQVVFTGPANANGFAIVSIPAPGLYYFSATTTAGGYSNQPVTAEIGRAGTSCSPSTITTGIVPTTLTGSGFWGEVTLKPGLLDPYYFPVQPGNSCVTSAASNIYIGTVSNFNVPAACECPAATIDLDFVLVLCGAAGHLVPIIQWCCPAYVFFPPDGGQLTCVGFGMQQTFGGQLAVLSGTGPGLGTCYPINMVGTGFSQGVGAMLFDCCTFGIGQAGCPFNVAVTQ